MPYELILTETRERVGLVTLNRPRARNALNNQLLHELMDALEAFDGDPGIGAMVVTGSAEAFASGADIKEMAAKSAAEMLESGFIATFGRLTAIRKPVVAAVSGWALGGGLELALACDMVVASETAKFGQPEIAIGVIPGGGATQRLCRAVGKGLAMEMILNNRVLDASEALQCGIVNRVVPVERFMREAMGLAQEIASRAPLAVQAAKRLVNHAYESSLADGLEQERREFHALFSSQDRDEGMRAFVEKRKPRWKAE
jgi:enoyl-CoA hydratase